MTLEWKQYHKNTCVILYLVYQLPQLKIVIWNCIMLDEVSLHLYHYLHKVVKFAGLEVRIIPMVYMVRS
jgi:hypothetical protein